MNSEDNEEEYDPQEEAASYGDDEEDEDDVEDFPEDEEDEDDILVRKALIEFSFKFSEYVKEVDHELWKRAVDYALTFTKVDGVEFVKDERSKPNEPPTT